MADRNENMAAQAGATAGASSHDQALRKGVLLLLLAAAFCFGLIARSRWPDGHWLRETIIWTGVVLIVVCIVGRTWTSLYIGGRKNQLLVTHGPYAISRNPLYVFSIIGAIGVGAQIGSIAAALACGVVTWAVFLWTARYEEAALETAFGDAYRRYCAEVPRFLPKPSRWRAPEAVEVYPRIVVTTFADALFFLLAIPLAQGIAYLHQTGSLPVLLSIP
jgi:protein-S-isoprenylcysteine O-methyltransferase Ste14